MKRSFKELPFYGALMEKPCTKHLNNIDMLRELNIVKTSEAFKGYASIEVID